ncbi:FkbM family methyltransferase [Mesobacterium pallidum]|uniref:FkbM family methyltransferase n=1 Tax=Mesobacterium pallidum TaxID=2872037 RepID=UPI001EE2A4CA|nr:FkbM family methyltransferase [Mesobacterium pallidum]
MSVKTDLSTPVASRSMPRRTIPGLDFDHMMVANRHGIYCLPTEFAEREIGMILTRGKVYEPDMLHFLCTRLGDGDIVTGGAFIGDFLPALSAAMAPGALIHTFEPHPVSFVAAETTLRLNRIGNVHISPVAVGEAPTKLPLKITRAGSGAAIAAGSRIVETADAGTIEVEVVRLDDLVDASRRVGVLHLDIEGHEAPALVGAARILSDNHPLVVLEAGKPAQRAAFLDQLETLVPAAAYRIGGVIENNTIFVPTAKL